jgi:hypothetical protein
MRNTRSPGQPTTSWQPETFPRNACGCTSTASRDIQNVSHHREDGWAGLTFPAPHRAIAAPGELRAPPCLVVPGADIALLVAVIVVGLEHELAGADE